jgi:hypothetical protein
VGLVDEVGPETVPGILVDEVRGASAVVGSTAIVAVSTEVGSGPFCETEVWPHPATRRAVATTSGSHSLRAIRPFLPIRLPAHKPGDLIGLHIAGFDNPLLDQLIEVPFPGLT